MISCALIQLSTVHSCKNRKLSCRSTEFKWPDTTPDTHHYYNCVSAIVRSSVGPIWVEQDSSMFKQFWFDTCNLRALLTCPPLGGFRSLPRCGDRCYGLWRSATLGQRWKPTNACTSLKIIKNIHSRFRYFLCLLNMIVQTCAYPTMERYHNYDILYSNHDYKKVVKHMHDELHTSTWLKA